MQITPADRFDTDAAHAHCKCVAGHRTSKAERSSLSALHSIRSMPNSPNDPVLPPLPPSQIETAAHLESRGIAAWQQGDHLLENLLRHGEVAEHASPARARSAPCFLCSAAPTAIAQAFPTAVVTAAEERRFSLATKAGPVDLLPLGTQSLEEALIGFGLSPFAVAHRPHGGTWADPAGVLPQLLSRQVSGLPEAEAHFRRAPRRFWLMARLLAEHGLEATPDLIDAAREALPSSLARLPQGAPARRELNRILMAPRAAQGLGFLRQIGLADHFFPKNHPRAETIVEALPFEMPLRWAAWLSGTPANASLRRWKMPHDVAREIERLLRVHPIDRSTAALAETGLRRLTQRFDRSERDLLLRWRRMELAKMESSEEKERAEAQLLRLTDRLDRLDHRISTTEQIAEVGLDGAAVMALLDCGPGRHVGEALRHLVQFTAEAPETVDRAQLESELKRWFAAR